MLTSSPPRLCSLSQANFVREFFLLPSLRFGSSFSLPPRSVAHSLLFPSSSSSLESKLVPDLLTEFNPSAVLDVSFNETVATIGQPLTISQVTSQPTVTVTPSSNATAFAEGAAFTVAMVDPATVGSDQSGGQVSSRHHLEGEGGEEGGKDDVGLGKRVLLSSPFRPSPSFQTRHWLVNNVYLTGTEAPYGLNFSTDAITTCELARFSRLRSFLSLRFRPRSPHEIEVDVCVYPPFLSSKTEDLTLLMDRDLTGEFCLLSVAEMILKKEEGRNRNARAHLAFLPFPFALVLTSRYTILLLPQPSTFTAPSGLSTPGVSTSIPTYHLRAMVGNDLLTSISPPSLSQVAISTFDFNAYVTASGLEAPVAGFYFVRHDCHPAASFIRRAMKLTSPLSLPQTVEQGTSTVSVEATSAVESSTLPAFAQSTAGGSSAAAG